MKKRVKKKFGSIFQSRNVLLILAIIIIAVFLIFSFFSVGFFNESGLFSFGPLAFFTTSPAATDTPLDGGGAPTTSTEGAPISGSTDPPLPQPTPPPMNNPCPKLPDGTTDHSICGAELDGGIWLYKTCKKCVNIGGNGVCRPAAYVLCDKGGDFSYCFQGDLISEKVKWSCAYPLLSFAVGETFCNGKIVISSTDTDCNSIPLPPAVDNQCNDMECLVINHMVGTPPTSKAFCALKGYENICFLPSGSISICKLDNNAFPPFPSTASCKP